ncbi:MAG: tyrosine-type recombinase/integrase [Acidobacteria bacterium]|nr:tyrosine-type recombinase/integrase [Acidobacteriota bacterium]
MRSARYCELYLRTLKEHFGQRKLRSISYGDLEAFKLKRLETPTARNQERSLANVHRTLALLRHLFNLAVREGWLLRNPFVADKSLINVADETKRERVLSGAEEMRLLAACVGPRAHLKPILICALDTGMRQGEIFKLQWADVDLVTRRLTMQAMNSKTLRARQIALTERLTRELEALRQWLSEPKTLLFEEEFAQSLVEQGLVSSLPDTDASLLPATNRQPVPVLGQSVSQAILEERR